VTNVENLLTMSLSGIPHDRDIRHTRVQTRRDIHPGFQSGEDGRDPVLSNNTPAIGNANHESAHACGCCVGDRHLGQAKISVTVWQTQLPEAPITTPVNDPVRRLGRQLIS
jgi:hypothetical protein